MSAVLRSELFKLRTTRTALALVLFFVALLLLVVIASGLALSTHELAERKNQFQLLADGSNAAAFAALLGVLAFTSEFRHGTIRPTLLATPRRARVVLAKMAASTITGVLLGALGVAIAFGLGRLLMSIRGIPAVLDHRDLALAIVGSVVVSGLWGALGAGIGAAVRNQVAAIVGLLVWELLVENVLFALLPGVGRYLPGQASNSLVQVEVPHLLGVLPGTLVLLGYVVVAGAIGLLVTERRDVA